MKKPLELQQIAFAFKVDDTEDESDESGEESDDDIVEEEEEDLEENLDEEMEEIWKSGSRTILGVERLG